MTSEQQGGGDNEADAIIMRCVEKGLGAMGGPMTAISYIESMSGVSRQDIPRNPEKFVWALRHLFRYGSILVLKSIVGELEAAPSPSGEVTVRVRAFADSLNEGIKSIESGII